MGSGFKSRGVHHWENSLRLAETQIGGCFVVSEASADSGTGLEPKGQGTAPRPKLQDYTNGIPGFALIDRHFSARILNAPSPVASNPGTLHHFWRIPKKPSCTLPAAAPPSNPTRIDGASPGRLRKVMARRTERCRRWQVSDSRGLVIIPVGRAGHW
jgi:hypothetical protein